MTKKIIKGGKVKPQDQAPTSTAPAAPPVERTHLWLTDRSRIVKGLQHCQYARYLEYHSENGYGIRRTAESLPLTTGTFVHNPIAEILQAGITGVTSESRPYIRQLIQQQVKRYQTLVSARGFLEEATTTEETRQIVAEQSALIEGLTWGFVKQRLPWLMSEFRVLAVEKEEILVLDCSCGLGDLVGDQEDHELRGCYGLGLMVRPDFVLERISDGAVGPHDLKTLGAVSKPWLDQWEVSVQMIFQTLAAEKAREVQASHFYIHGLIKGMRGQEYNPETGKYDLPGIRKQNTKLLYAYWKPADPPIQKEDDWKLNFKYWSPTGGRDKKGGNTTLQGKGYIKRPVWDAEFKGKPADWTPMEWWIEKFLPAEELEKMFITVGPHQRPDYLIQEVLKETIAEERGWQEKLWKIHDGEATTPLIRRSWNCQKWGRPCEFKGICFKDFSGQQPLETGLFKLRRPHHEPEVKQCVARGVELPPEDVEMEEVTE